MTIKFDPAMPPYLIPLIEQTFEPLKVLIPPHMERIYFQWTPESDAGMACEPDQPYRFIRIRITPNSFDATSDSEGYLRHELAHWFNAPIADAAKNAIREIVGADYPTPGSKVAELYLNHVLEATNVDLEQAFKRVLQCPQNLSA